MGKGRFKDRRESISTYNVTEKFELRTWTAEDGLSTGKEPEEISECIRL